VGPRVAEHFAKSIHVLKVNERIVVCPQAPECGRHAAVPVVEIRLPDYQ